MRSESIPSDLSAFLNDMVDKKLLTIQQRDHIELELANEPLWRESFVFQFVYRGRSLGFIYPHNSLEKFCACLTDHKFDNIDRVYEVIPTEKRIHARVNRAKELVTNEQ